VGQTVEVPRNTVDDDFRIGCSKGLHIGTYEYANSFAGPSDRIVLVKVNPADAVSVPLEENCTKLRAWRYKVIEEVARRSPPLSSETFGDIPDDNQNECYTCGQTSCDGYCDGEDRPCEYCGSEYCYGSCEENDGLPF
jgi:hypothetical protein